MLLKESESLKVSFEAGESIWNVLPLLSSLDKNISYPTEKDIMLPRLLFGVSQHSTNKQ
jgi:hypothetical protein